MEKTNRLLEAIATEIKDLEHVIDAMEKHEPKLRMNINTAVEYHASIVLKESLEAILARVTGEQNDG